jgi:MFS family permease
MVSLITNIGAIVAGYFIILPAYAITDNVKSKKAPLFDKRAFRVSLTLFFTTISYGGIVTFLPLYADERGISNIGLFFTIYAIALLVTRPYAGKYYDRKGPNNIILYGLLLIFVSIFMLAFAKTMPVFLLSGILLGLGFGAVQPTIFAHAMVGIEPERRGIINGTVMTAFDLGMGFGSVFLGIIANMAGYANMYLITSFTVLFGLVVFFLFPGKKANIERS